MRVKCFLVVVFLAQAVAFAYDCGNQNHRLVWAVELPERMEEVTRKLREQYPEAEAQFLKTFHKAETPQEWQQIRTKILEACHEAMPGGRNRAHVGFARLDRILIHELGSGRFSMELEYGKGKRNDRETQVFFTDNRAWKMKEIHTDGTLTSKDMPRTR